jgi:hypothetical protein
MWDELAGVCAWWGLPWCVAGDFNVVRFPSKDSGTAAFSAAMMEFSDFISDLDLVDIPLLGGSLVRTYLVPGSTASCSR